MKTITIVKDVKTLAPGLPEGLLPDLRHPRSILPAVRPGPPAERDVPRLWVAGAPPAGVELLPAPHGPVRGRAEKDAARRSGGMPIGPAVCCL
jgi:hypothetical protein